jgi:hypothetical protein
MERVTFSVFASIEQKAASRYLSCGMYAQCGHQELMVMMCFLLIHACVLAAVALLPSYGDHATCYLSTLAVLPPCCACDSSHAPADFDHTFLVIVLHLDMAMLPTDGGCASCLNGTV